jgi:hypothetical protein
MGTGGQGGMAVRIGHAACVFLVLPAMAVAADADQPGRDFPKTLIFDEPGIDDEISLPTFSGTPRAGGGYDTDLDFELDKRLTGALSVQVNIGYSLVRAAMAPDRDGWQDSDLTLKYVVLANPAAEQLASVSIIREFGGTGAARIGAAPVGATTAALNVGQGFGAVPVVLLKPFAVTGSVGYLVPDNAGGGAAQQAVLGASLQYSLDVLLGDGGRPGFLRPLIPIVEASFAVPTDGHAMRRGTLAPGLIYAGDGFQLAAEALLPLTRATGHGTGFIAQLNLSLRRFGISALARPLF